ncbi:MAG: dethiobiotin synthase [Candidatus Omnitrophica bacterium]|nr:dethiobiotin synthase [Candidatus Omnitrophota bacterium]MCM8830955.1 dethiobiotin synthase [Candidatus Omnitrophota bacterium]
MRAIFVAGTDTGVGKTVVCGLVAKYFKEKGFNVVTQKWFQTGSCFPTDINTHLNIIGKNINLFKKYFKYMCPYILKFPSSPHLAAKLEGKKILINKIKKSFNYLLNEFDFVIVEGTGGILVPYSSKRLIIDIVEEFNIPTIIVVANKLGAINHTLLTVEALDKKNIKIIGIIFNNLMKNQNKIILEDNVRIIKKISGQNILGVLHYKRNVKLLYKDFLHIGEKLSKIIKDE